MTRTIALALGLSLVGCAARDSGDGDAELASAAADSSVSGQSEGALLVVTLDSTLVSQSLAALTPDQVAAAIAANVTARLSPPGCASASATGATVAMTFTSCTGPRGLADVSGSLSLEIQSVTATSIAAHATASALGVSGATLDVDATASYALAGATQTLSVTSSTTGAGPLGHTVTHAGQYTVAWDASCATVDGTWASAVDDHARGLSVNVARCAAACPTGSVTRTSAAAATLQIDFDGTARAAWSSSRGGAGTIDLPCGG